MLFSGDDWFYIGVNSAECKKTLQIKEKKTKISVNSHIFGC